jgi:hypothetical protein
MGKSNSFGASTCRPAAWRSETLTDRLHFFVMDRPAPRWATDRKIGMVGVIFWAEQSMTKHLTRRGFLDLGAAAISAASFGVSPFASSAEEQLPDNQLDRNSYIHNMSVRAHYFTDQVIGSKMQLMVRGQQRVLFHSYKNQAGEMKGRSIDITDPLKAQVVGEGIYDGYQVQLAYHHTSAKWILITSVAPVEPQVDLTRGKNVNAPGLRGIRIYDATDPAKLNLLSEWSCDQGDPKRTLQEGSGTHRNFYTGGRYAYLDTSPDNSYVNYEYARANGVQILDLLDPATPKFVSNIWIPGQRAGEEEQYSRMSFYGNHKSATGLHGGFIVPENVEDGGALGYGTWCALGVRIHDISNPQRPVQVGMWDSKDPKGMGFQYHTIDVTRLDRGIAMVSPEMTAPACTDAWYNSYILDVRDPRHLKEIAKLPIPSAPADARYTSFCKKLGRFGPHNAPHQKAPGRAAENFTCYTYFNGGLQCYDISDPKQPRIVAYFVPPQGGSLDKPGSYARDSDAIYAEWDRKLLWLGTSTGLYLLSTPALGETNFKPAAVKDWSLPALRRHWPRGGEQRA